MREGLFSQARLWPHLFAFFFFPALCHVLSPVLWLVQLAGDGAFMRAPAGFMRRDLGANAPFMPPWLLPSSDSLARLRPRMGR